MLKSETTGSGELCFLAIEKWRLPPKDTLLYFIKTTWMAAFLAKLAQPRVRRHARGTKDRVHLNPSNAASQHQLQCHLCPEHHLRHPVTMSKFNFPKLTMCHPNMHIHMLLFLMPNFSILMYMPRIASTRKISFQICWVMKAHPLVSALSAMG